MGKPIPIQEVEANLEGWDFLEKLPKELQGFTLKKGSGITGQVLEIAAYVNEKEHTCLQLTYTAETFDYVPVKNIGLHNFRDIRYFFRNRDDFAEALLATDEQGRTALEKLLAGMKREAGSVYDFEYSNLGTEKWEYVKTLPEKIGSYELYITPDKPVEYITGSLIFLDYTDFERGNQLYFVYNSYRNEIYAGEKKNFKPQTTSLFTVPEENIHGERLNRKGKKLANDFLVYPVEELLPWLTEKMEKHLMEALEELAK